MSARSTKVWVRATRTHSVQCYDMVDNRRREKQETTNPQRHPLRKKLLQIARRKQSTPANVHKVPSSSSPDSIIFSRVTLKGMRLLMIRIRVHSLCFLLIHQLQAAICTRSRKARHPPLCDPAAETGYMNTVRMTGLITRAGLWHRVRAHVARTAVKHFWTNRKLSSNNANSQTTELK